MDKMILLAGVALVSLGVGFLVAGEADSTLHQAYSTGGYLWIVVGLVTAGLGARAKREKTKTPIKKGAV